MSNFFDRYPASGGSGTVTSIGITDSSTTPIFSISGSPVTTNGTIALTLVNEPANTVFAGPTSGSPAQPTFRALVAADIPNISATYVTQSEVGTANGVAPLGASGKISVGYLPADVFVYQGTWNAATNTPTLQDSTGVAAGYVYWVSVGAAGPISGLNNASMVNFQVGDLVLFNGSQYELTTAAAGVTAVNGAQGAVTLTAGALDSQAANATGLAWAGTVLSAQSASATEPGLVNTTTQVFAGAKEFLTGITADGGLSSTNGNITLTNGTLNTNSIAQANGSLRIDVANQLLKDSQGYHRVDWTNGLLTDNNNVISMNWDNRVLYDSTGASQMTIGTSGIVLANPLAISSGGIGLTSTSAHFTLIGPTSGSGAPTFRALAASDIPTLNQNTTGTAANITATSNSTLTTLSALSLPGSQVSGNISGNAANITGTSNSTLTTLSALSLPGSQVSGNISGNAANVTATSNSTITTLSALSLPYSQVTGGPSPSGPTGKYYSGYFPTNTTWYVTSTGYAQIPLISGSATLTARGSPTLAVSAASGNYPGITFTPASSSAIYFVSMQFSSVQQLGGNFGSYQLTDGTYVIQASPNILTSTGYPTPMSICGIYAPGTGSAVTIQLYAACSGGYIGISNNTGAMASLGSSIEWQIFQIA